MPIACGSRRAGALDLGAHVLHLQRLDRVPVELQLLGDIADRGLPAAAADIERKALGEVRIVRQKIQPLALHAAAIAARHAPHLELQNDAKAGARQVANPPHPPVVPALLDPPAAAANRFFERRSRRDDPHIRITEHAAHGLLRTKTRERIPIRQPTAVACPICAMPHHAKFRAPLQTPESQYPRMLPPL